MDMDMKQLLDKLRPSAPRIIVRETYTVKMENGKVVVVRKE